MTNPFSHLNALPIPQLGALRVSGPDRATFLQGQLTQDTRLAVPGTPLLTGWASPKGRLLMVAWLLEWNDALWLIMPIELIAPVQKRLQLFVLRAKVQIESTELSIGRVSANIKQNQNELGFVNNFFYDDTFFCFFPADADSGLLITAAKPETDAGDMGNYEWRSSCIRAGLPQVFASTAEEFVPQMLNLDLLEAISFNKGCYVGQEIVARTQNLGRIKRRMFAFRADNASAEAGQPVYANGKHVGQIVDAVTDQRQRTSLLAVIVLDAVNEKLSLEANGDSALQATVLPYLIPELDKAP